MKKNISLFIISLFIISTSFAQKKNLKTDTVTIMGTCGQCKDRIEGTLKKYGIYKSHWSDETLLLTVTYDSLKFSLPLIQKKLADVGHESVGYYSKDDVYNNLPECCKYDRLEKPNSTTEKKDATKNTAAESEQLHTIKGVVLEETKTGKFIALKSATIILLNAHKTIITDSLGGFLFNTTLPEKITVSYVGYKADTVEIIAHKNVVVFLRKNNTTTLSEVIVNAKQRATYIATNSVFNTTNMGIKELTKAACCNLSESFETSPSVDVSYSDALTGIKQIQLLGLSGNYTQLLTETVPEINGLSGSYGLTFVPGPWLEGLQVTKGIGSVANGYESIAGQINIEERKPDKMEKLFVNGYANMFGRLETSINYAKQLNSELSTALLTHANGVVIKNDENKDGFLDMPLGKQLNVINRWKYANTNGVIAQFAIKALKDERQAGDINFNSNTDKLTTNKYGIGIHVNQILGTAKLGYIFPNHKYKSIGLLLTANNFNNNAYYGLKNYDAKQNSFYANLIYQSIISSTTHKFRTGLSFNNQNYHEMLLSSHYKRKENIVGAFFEYTYTGEKLSAVAGLREDYHNYFGLITTPRLHVKYDFSKQTNIRLSVGTGFRMANIFAENASVFASSRVIEIQTTNQNYGYGLQPENAVNYGINFVHNYKHNTHNGTLSVDFYRTQFNNQTVVDVDANPQTIKFYNLNGKSFSNSLQAELNYELVDRLDIRLAYRMLDVQTTYGTLLLNKPLVAKHRAFINVAYETNNHFKFDVTTQWLSKKRLPNTRNNPVDKRMEEFSPSYFQVNAQITKQLSKQWDAYLGVENLTNYTQQKLMIDAQNPFSKYFDASMIWGPINGTMVYVGFRFKIKE